MKRLKKTLSFAFAAFATATAATSVSEGQVKVYTGTNPGNSSWTLTQNWNDGSSNPSDIAGSASLTGNLDIASFSGVNSQHSTVSFPTALGSNRFLGQILLAQTYGSNVVGGPTGLTISHQTAIHLNSNAGVLLSNTATSKNMLLTGGSIFLRSTGNINVSNTGRLITIGSSMNESLGSQGFNKVGNGTLIVNGALNYTGNSIVSGGIMVLNSATSSTKVVANAGGTFRLDESETIGHLSGAGAVDLQSFSLNVANGISAEFSGSISGSGGLIKSNSGNMTLSGNSNYSSTAVNSGSLLVTGSINNSLGVTVASGATMQVGNGGTSGSVVGNILNNGQLIFDRSNSYTYSGSVSGSGDVEQAGTGTLILNGSSSFNGNLAVSSGVAQVDGALANATATVASGAKLSGTGSIGGAVTVDGTLAPGASIGTLSTGSLTFANNSSFEYELNTTSMLADLVNINGDLTIGNNVTLTLASIGTDVFVPYFTSKLTLFGYTGTWNGGVFSGLADDSEFDFGANRWLINYNDTSAGSNGGIGSSFVTITAVPEGSLGLWLTVVVFGFVAAGPIVRRKR